MAQTPTRAWFPDPFARYERRYWDGTMWTHHVWSNGIAAVDEPGESAAVGESVPAAGHSRLSVLRRLLRSDVGDDV